MRARSRLPLISWSTAKQSVRDLRACWGRSVIPLRMAPTTSKAPCHLLGALFIRSESHDPEAEGKCQMSEIQRISSGGMEVGEGHPGWRTCHRRRIELGL